MIGYISQLLFSSFGTKDSNSSPNSKKNMRPRLLPLRDKILLRKRMLIETVNDQLKNICQLEHTRPRSPTNCFVHVLSALIAYTYQEKKPSLHFTDKEFATLPALVC